MSKTVYYKKVGRRYEPVSEYDPELMSAFPRGCHLVVSNPNGRSTRYNINPALAPMIAAGRYAQDAMSATIIKASKLRHGKINGPLTPRQSELWDDLIEELGETAKYLEWASAREVAEAGVEAMVEQAEHLMRNPMLKAAYDEFMMLAKLVLENEKN